MDRYQQYEENKNEVIENFKKELLKYQDLIKHEEEENHNWKQTYNTYNTQTRDVMPLPGDLLGQLYIGKDGKLYFHADDIHPTDDYSHDTLIETVDDIKKIRTKKMLKA